MCSTDQDQSKRCCPRLVHPSKAVELCLTCFQGHPPSEQEAWSDRCRWRGLLLWSMFSSVQGHAGVAQTGAPV